MRQHGRDAASDSLVPTLKTEGLHGLWTVFTGYLKVKKNYKHIVEAYMYTCKSMRGTGEMAQ